MKNFFYLIFVFLIVVFFVFYFQKENEKKEIKLHKSEEYKILLGNLSDSAAEIESVREYRNDLKKVLESELPIMLLDNDELESRFHKIAQRLAINDKRFIKNIFDQDSGKALHNAIMRVFRLTSSDRKNLNFSCSLDECFRVDMYNFYTNTTVSAIVDTEKMKVLEVNEYKDMQSDINKRLTEIAKEIAAESSLVEEFLGRKPSVREATMPNVKTSLRGSSCERLKHLCVAPTFLDYKNKRAIWAIVDLTDMRVVGVRETYLGEDVFPAAVSERRIRNDYIMTNYCLKKNHFSKNGWEFDYSITPSDGLEIKNLYFNGKKILRSSKIVDWHVSYVEGGKRGGDDDDYSFGYSDAIGCPMFSSSSVIPFEGPFVEEIEKNGKKGFAFVQDFRNPLWPLACNYRYQNRFEFYNDGSFRIMGLNLGKGCGNDGWYRPVFRIDPDFDSSKEVLEVWDGNKWNLKTREFYLEPIKKEKVDNEGRLFKVFDSESERGFYILPYFADNKQKQDDRAYSYFTLRKNNVDEGDKDLVSIGPCCNTDYRQGPEKFLNNENILNNDLVFWYVPQIKNNDKEGEEYCWAETKIVNGQSVAVPYPCSAGPIFVPFDKK